METGKRQDGDRIETGGRQEGNRRETVRRRQGCSRATGRRKDRRAVQEGRVVRCRQGDRDGKTEETGGGDQTMWL